MGQLLPDSELQNAVAEIDELDSTMPTHEADAGVEELEGSPPATATEWISREFLKISMRRRLNSASPLLSMALPNSWFEQMGLVDLCKYECGVLSRYYER